MPSEANRNRLREMGKRLQALAREVKGKNPGMKHVDALREAGKIFKKESQSAKLKAFKKRK